MPGNVLEKNYEEVALASTARTASAQAGTLRNMEARGVALLLDVTVNADTINSIEVQGVITGTLVTLYQFGTLGINTTGKFAFLVYPGAATAGSWKSTPAQGTIPTNWSVHVTHAGSSSVTYSLTASYIK